MNPIDIALGLAGLALGLSTMKKGATRLANGLSPGASTHRRIPSRLPPVTQQGKHMKTRAGQMRTTLYGVNSLDDRMAIISAQANRGKTDPRVIAWARRALSKKCRDGWNGEQWCVPEKDTRAEVAAIFMGLRQDIRYTSDVRGVDTYAHPKATLAARGGDCLPGDTLLLTPQGLRPISDIRVGDTIHDGTDWTRVTNWWDKGEQPLLNIELNNRSFLRCTAGHQVFRVTRANGEHQEARADSLERDDQLLQPRHFAAGQEHLNTAHAAILGAYLAEGWWDDSKGLFCIAGVPNGKGLRELVLQAAELLGLETYPHPRYIGFKKDAAWLIEGCGKQGAASKRLPHLNFDIETVGVITQAMERGDGGFQSGLMVYSTVSRELALQYRTMKRMQGFSASMRCLSAEEHGGAGSLPLWRITVRSGNQRKPWARIRSVEPLPPRPTFDIETMSHRIYLPESDVIVHNCDEYASTGCAALMAVGIPCRYKVIRTKDSPTPNHIYIQGGWPKEAPKQWMSLDASVPVKPGWEAPASMVAESWIYTLE